MQITNNLNGSGIKVNLTKDISSESINEALIKIDDSSGSGVKVNLIKGVSSGDIAEALIRINEQELNIISYESQTKAYRDETSVLRDNSQVSANNANVSATNANNSALLSIAKANEAILSANNAKASELLSAQYKVDNENIKTNVQTLSNSAYDSANTASIKANEAIDSAIISTTQANISIAKASEASTYAINSNASAVNALASENKAEEWASKEYGLEVEPGLYSAKHYAIEASNNTSNVISVNGMIGDVVLTKSNIGLENVDNTSDINKPISTAVQTALDNKVEKLSKQSLDPTNALSVSGTTVSLYKGDGTFDSINTQDTVYTHPNSGVTVGTYTKVTVNTLGHITAGASLLESDIPSLDASKITTGTIDAVRLPSFVDDVLEFVNLAGFPTIGETGKIYIALDTNKTYRWSGSTYVYITSGAVDSVAGKTGVVTLVKGDVGLGNVDNTSDLNKPISTATQTALNLKVDKVTGKGLSTEDYTTAEKTKLSGLSNYALPIASTTVLGGVKAGTNVTIDANGVLSAGADVGTLLDFTTSLG